MNYELLKGELAKDEYKGLSDQEAADAINAKTVATVRNIPTVEIATWAAENGVMAALWAAERSPETPAALYGVIKTLLTVLDRLNDWRVVDDGGNPTAAAMAMMGGLQQAGLMTPEQAEELVGMAFTDVRWVDKSDLGDVAYWDVARARTGVRNGE